MACPAETHCLSHKTSVPLVMMEVPHEMLGELSSRTPLSPVCSFLGLGDAMCALCGRRQGTFDLPGHWGYGGTVDTNGRLGLLK